MATHRSFWFRKRVAISTRTPPEPRHWNAAPQLRFERLLRETNVPAGLLVSPQAIRLVYAPKGESSGHITFKIGDMVQVAGRPILAALHMLLSSERLFSLATEQRLPALLAASRKHQNLVSTKLSRQVMEALFDLLRGFQAAHDQNNILEDVLRTDPNQVYAGLLTVLLAAGVRLVRRKIAACFPPTPSSSITTPWPGCLNACVKTRRTTRTPWMQVRSLGAIVGPFPTDLARREAWRY